MQGPPGEGGEAALWAQAHLSASLKSWSAAATPSFPGCPESLYPDRRSRRGRWERKADFQSTSRHTVTPDPGRGASRSVRKEAQTQGVLAKIASSLGGAGGSADSSPHTSIWLPGSQTHLPSGPGGGREAGRGNARGTGWKGARLGDAGLIESHSRYVHLFISCAFQSIPSNYCHLKVQEIYAVFLLLK